MNITDNPWVLARQSGDCWQIVGRFRNYTQAAIHAALIRQSQGHETTVWYEQLDAAWFESEIRRLRWEQGQWKKALKCVLNGRPTGDLPAVEVDDITICDCRAEILCCERQIYRIVDSAIYWGMSYGLYLLIDGDFRFHFKEDTEDDRQRGAA